MDATIDYMATKKKLPTETPSAPDRHKPGSKMVRVRGPLAGPAEEQAVSLAMDLTEWVNVAVREKLERDGLWPPTAQK